ncbi:glyoxal oxidase N-terminus-domain-containing protein [Exophiala viscosa]|uniref:Glyoxal oxidase N-terminus-domain-containing protein n=1 Tax=Exophiala viscosa TaxID=2486360 RepID=A0AAN6DPU9_9EURO|nr:glyoxal oxidase N-terminus-domain-containing protein [Exophiala viscosa]
MADSIGEYSVDPIRASTLLDLEGWDASEGSTTSTSPEARRTGLWIRGLDTRFRALWRGGRVIGIGLADDVGTTAGQGRASLSLHLLATTLLADSNRLQALKAQSLTATPEATEPDSATVYIVAPHTYQTIPMLHALLAKTLSDSPMAIELLKGVQLLQYFDFAGLAEAVAEISDAVYRRTPKHSKTRSAHVPTNDIVLVQGLGETMTATQRRSGHLHANALLAGLTRNTGQLSRISSDVLVLVDAPIEVGVVLANDAGQQTPPAKRFASGLELYSAFTGPRGESLRLVCGNETLSRTLDDVFDSMVVVHNGFSRVKKPNNEQGKSHEQIIEVYRIAIMDLLSILFLLSCLVAHIKARSHLHEVNTSYEYFKVVGSSGVPAMHAAVLPPTGKVVFLDKVEDYSELRLPNQRWAYSSIYDPETHELIPLLVATNPFCCGGSFLPDGRLLAVGGNNPLLWLDPTVEDGLDGIRYISSENGSYEWKEPGNKLASKRWYASAQTMSDGSVFVAAGIVNGMTQNNFSNNNPTYEILDGNGTTQGQNIPMDILVENMPYFTYPFLHLLPDGSLFIFTDRSSEIFNGTANSTIKSMPNMPGMHRTYPNTGGSVMLPLHKGNNYEPEVMICGGGQTQAIDSQCDPTCGRLRPMSSNPEWQMSSMPEPRGMVEGVLLLDGTVLWLNGCQRGAQGFGLATSPALQALIYDPRHKAWNVSGCTTIARLYHSVALLLLDGTVLVAGSNPNEMPVMQSQVEPNNQYKAFPTEFRIEIYTPPYLRGDNATKRPTNITLSSLELNTTSQLSVDFDLENVLTSLDVILYAGGFVTHAVHMGQVLVYLDNYG